MPWLMHIAVFQCRNEAVTVSFCTLLHVHTVRSLNLELGHAPNFEHVPHTDLKCFLFVHNGIVHGLTFLCLGAFAQSHIIKRWTCFI